MLSEVHCKGAPRDLGLDQGRALSDRIQAEAARIRPGGSGWLARARFEWAPSARVAAVHRDTLRYFPHMAERAMGLASGSGAGERALAGYRSGRGSR